MKCTYWKGSKDGIIKKIQAKEEKLVKLAEKMGIDPNKLSVEFNKNQKVFKKWYSDETTGIVEKFDDEVIIAINGNALKYYSRSLQVAAMSASADEVCELYAKAYIMMAAIVMSEYAVKNGMEQKGMYNYGEDGEESPKDIITHMYISARVRMSVPEIAGLVTVLNDPYIYMNYEEVNEFDWRELLNSVAYYTEQKSGEAKTFWSAMVKRDPGKALQEPNKVDIMVKGLEEEFNKYLGV